MLIGWWLGFLSFLKKRLIQLVACKFLSKITTFPRYTLFSLSYQSVKHASDYDDKVQFQIKAYENACVLFELFSIFSSNCNEMHIISQATSAVAAFTDRLCIQSNGKHTALRSAQQVLSCCHKGAAKDGCNGGWPMAAFDYIRRNGLSTGGDYDSKTVLQHWYKFIYWNLVISRLSGVKDGGTAFSQQIFCTMELQPWGYNISYRWREQNVGGITK